MGKIKSPAGEVAFSLKSLKHEGTDLVIIGTMGIWEAEVHLPYGELLKFSLNRSTLLTVITFPILIFRHWSKRFHCNEKSELDLS